MIENGWQKVKDGWISSEGSLEEDGRILLHRHAGKFRLTEIYKGFNGFVISSQTTCRETVWEADTYEECLAIARSRENHKRAEATYAAHTAHLEEEAPVPGVTFIGHKDAGSKWAHVEAIRDGKCVGRFDSRHTGWEATWILGEPTINTSSYIYDASLKYRGVGRAMHDIMEKLCGLPLAPHGLHGVGGSLSADAWVFWQKRAAIQRVPGFANPDVDAREKHYRNMRTLFYLERNRFMPDIAMAVALAKNWTTEALVWNGDSERTSVLLAWCVLPSGEAFTGKGFGSRDTAMNEAIAELHTIAGRQIPRKDIQIIRLPPEDMFSTMVARHQETRHCENAEDDITELVAHARQDADLILRRHTKKGCPDLEPILKNMAISSKDTVSEPTASLKR